jgi:hypothetical protein
VVAERSVRLLIGLCLLSLTGNALAHDLGVARLILTPISTDSVILEAKLPEKLRPADPVVPNGCSFRELGQRLNGRLSRLVSWQIDCIGGWPKGDDALVFDWQREGALVMVQRDGDTRSTQFVDADSGAIELHLGELLGGQGNAMATAARYVGLGSEHILLGVDHLAFVLVLCLLARGWRLVKLVTAFTVGHSFTLALAVLGWVEVPVPPIEAVIALSIVFVAREAVLSDKDRRNGFLLVAAFGMLHGLGFASALAEMGVDPDYLLLSLFMFNLGVELGQLLFVAVAVGTGFVFTRVFASHRERLRGALAFGVGSLAVFWTFERVAAFTLGA